VRSREQGLSVAIDPTSIGRIAALLGVEIRWKPADRQEL
jgi:hypothetical protein